MAEGSGAATAEVTAAVGMEGEVMVEVTAEVETEVGVMAEVETEVGVTDEERVGAPAVEALEGVEVEAFAEIRAVYLGEDLELGWEEVGCSEVLKAEQEAATTEWPP